MRTFRRVGFLLLLALAGCSQSGLLEKIAGPGNDRLAQSYIAQLRANKFDLIEKNLDPSLRTDTMDQELAKMAAQFPAGEPLSVKLIGAHALTSSDIHKIDLSYEYEFPGAWMGVVVGFQEKDGVSTIYRFRVQKRGDSLEHWNRFTLKNRDLLQYAVLTLAVLIPLLILSSLIACIRTRMGKNKWLWILFILLGLGRFGVNWTTGGWGYQLTALQLFGASAFAPLNGAWVVSISLPVGAIVFLLARKRLTVGMATAAPAAEQSPPI